MYPGSICRKQPVESRYFPRLRPILSETKGASVIRIVSRTALVGMAVATLAVGVVRRADAQVTTLTVKSRAPFANGQAFGSVGPYEEITGLVVGEIDPRDPRNAVITDIDLAPRLPNGNVAYRTTFTLRKPVDMTKGAGVVFYNVVNRGRHQGPEVFQYGGDPGDGFLYRLGQTVLWSGWQGDMPISGGDGERIDVPIAKNPDGSSVTGRVVERFINVAGNLNTQSLAGAGRTPLTLDTTSATLISATSETQAGVKGGIREIASTDFAFADCRTVPFPGTPDPSRICVKSGFDPALLYELVYTAKDPYVLGVGMAAMRDVVSFFRYEAQDAAGTPNPIFGQVRHVIGMGNSQAGRFAKAFINLGFNEDMRGRIIWDGLNPRIAGMLGSFNTRFAQPGDIAELYYPGGEGPLWWGDYKDNVRSLPTWGILHRCTASKTCPKITETYGGPEFWYSRGSVGIAGPSGKEDLPLPDNVRRYYHAGTTHGGGMGGFKLGTASTNPNSLANNPNPERDIDRALYVALVDWVVKGTLPPPSAYPRVSNGTLVPATSAAMGWPNIPNTPKPDGVINSVLDYDYGPAYRYNDSSGVITNVPPRVKRVIPTLVAKVDADGNDVAGVKSVLFRVPLGTYTGWNPIASGILKGRERSLAAGYIPFAKTKAERLASGDPRLSIEERYPNLWTYYSKAATAAAELVNQRFLLPDDAVRLLKQVLTDMEASKLLPD